MKEFTNLYRHSGKTERKERFVMKTKCANCGELILREEAVKYEENYFCKECFCDKFCICDDCGAIVSSDNVNRVNSGRHNEKIVCCNCIRNYNLCSCCGEYISDSEIWASDSETIVCNGCSQHYSLCEGCGAVIHEDAMYYCSDDGRHYCEECYNEHNCT